MFAVTFNPVHLQGFGAFCICIAYHKNGFAADCCLVSGPGAHSGDPVKPVKLLFVLCTSFLELWG